MEEVSPGKTPERDPTQKGQMKRQKKTKHEITKSKKGGCRTRGNQDRGGRRKKLKGTERNMKNKRETQRVIIIAQRVTAIRP